MQTDYIGPFPATPITYTVPALDERTTQFHTRPFVAGGAKVYVNDRVFIRPEALMSFGSGFRELTLRVAVGADF